MKMANDANGLCVLKKLLVRSCENLMFKQHFQILIVNNLNDLIQNSFGNYIIQIIVEVNIET